MPYSIYTKLNNNLTAFNFDRDLTNDSMWGKGHTDLPRMKAGKIGGQFWVAYTNCDSQYKDSVQLTLRQIDVIKRLIDRYPNNLKLVKNARDIEDVWKSGKIASMIAVEGGHSLDSSLAVLRLYHELGVRYVTLTHTCNTPWLVSFCNFSILHFSNLLFLLFDDSAYFKNIYWSLYNFSGQMRRQLMPTLCTILPNLERYTKPSILYFRKLINRHKQFFYTADYRTWNESFGNDDWSFSRISQCYERSSLNHSSTCHILSLVCLSSLQQLPKRAGRRSSLSRKYLEHSILNSQVYKYLNFYSNSIFLGGGQNLKRPNVERPIFRKFVTSNIEITKVELFDFFIFKFISYIYVCLNCSNTQNIW